MPTVNVTIPSPIIVAPAHFTVRYRDATALGLPAWATLPDQTNAPFSFTVPTAGSWILGVTYVNPDGVACAEVYYPFDTFDPCVCITVADPLVRRLVPGGPPYLVLPYTGGGAPDCGVTVWYRELGSVGTGHSVTLIPMPASPIQVPVKTMVPVEATVTVNCCDDNVATCFQDSVAVEVESVALCEPITLLNTVVDLVQSLTDGTFYLRVTFPGPTPPSLCQSMFMTAAQQDNMVTGLPGPKDFIATPLLQQDFYSIAGGGWQIMKPLKPRLILDYDGIRYDVVLRDCCENQVHFGVILFMSVQVP